RAGLSALYAGFDTSDQLGPVDTTEPPGIGRQHFAHRVHRTLLLILLQLTTSVASVAPQFNSRTTPIAFSHPFGGSRLRLWLRRSRGESDRSFRVRAVVARPRGRQWLVRIDASCAGRRIRCGSALSAADR